MNTLQTRHALAAVLILLGALPIPNANASVAATGIDNFESYALFSQPSDPHYTYSSSGGPGSAFIDNSLGTKTLKIDGGTGGIDAIFTTTHDGCQGPSNDASGNGYHLNFNVQTPSIGTSGTVQIGFADTAANFASTSAGTSTTIEWAYIKIATLGGQITASSKTAASTGIVSTGTAAVLALNTWAHVDLQCSIPDIVAPSTNVLRVSASVPAGGQSETTDQMTISKPVLVFRVPAGIILYIDDLAFDVSTAQSGYVFCSSIGSTNFGFNFLEDVTDQGDPTIGGAQGESVAGSTYIFHAGGGNGLALLGRDLSLGSATSRAYNTTFKIEASTEGQSSDFRVTYSFINTFARGNGDTTGSFASGIQMRFTETGNLWHMETRQINGGVITSFGGVRDVDDPNDSHTYQFILDTRTTSPRVALLDFEGATIFSNTLPAFASDLAIYSQWYSSDHGSVLFQAETGLSPPGTVNVANPATLSTCIYDIEGTALSQPNPGNVPCKGTGCSTGTSTSTSTVGSFLGIDPANLDPTGNGDPVSGGFFLSLMLILGFAVVGAGIIPGTSASTLLWGAGLGAALGFAWTIFLGVMPPIITFILIVVGAGLLGIRFFAQGRSSGGG